MASGLKVHNTLSRKKEAFSPLSLPGKGKDEVWAYVCGITPYDFSHVGHGRSYTAFDVIRRYLEFSGYRVKHVQNFTDVDDKILKRASELNEDPLKLSKRFSDEYFTDIRRLGVRDAHVYPLISTHLKEIVTFVQRLLDKGMAYANESGVYFSVSKFKGYGKLSHQSLDQLKSGARVEVDEQKQAPEDFALWKNAKPHEKLSWNPAQFGAKWTPCLAGRPGWHI
ncbi:Cysteine--tRNA ligase [uncultured archaeon]|nr:Cysteine--tRNA ligase [uncultured archaeon]